MENNEATRSSRDESSEQEVRDPSVKGLQY